MRRVAIGAVGRDDAWRQGELRATALTVEYLHGNRFAVSASGGHRNQEILFFGLAVRPELLVAGAMFANQARAIRRKNHLRATLGAHETIRRGLRWISRWKG